MNKAVHALVYVILAVAGVALYFEMKLFEKKELLTDSNEQLRKCIVDLSSYIEAENAPQGAVLEAKQDVSPREAREVDDPEMVNLLEKYNSQYEATNIKCLDWGNAQSAQLRRLYALDAEGNKQPDQANPGKFIMEGKDTAAELIKQIVGRAKYQKDTLKETRKELSVVRTKLQELVADYNELPKEIRLNKIEIEKKNKEIETLTAEKTKVETDLENSKKEVEDLKSDVASLKDEVSAAKDETEAAKEDLEKSKKLVETLLSRLKNQSSGPRPVTGGPVAGGGQLTSGDKGKVASVQNEKLFVIVQFEDAALDELIGSERNGALPPHEMLVVRPAKGEGGKERIVGKIRLRQWTPKSNLVVADILKDWQQEPIEKNDVIRPD
ncbi:MAG: hypothetical protein IJL17_03530 [Kiritimatiellae bacterium]|nr:hypothetical protein [Kiritimatiellia bacterium]